MSENSHTTQWFLWPFSALWRLLTFVLNLTGRIITAIIGLIIVIIGMILSVTIFAAPIGIPMIILGILLMLRSIF
jgi:hypothetical protein